MRARSSDPVPRPTLLIHIESPSDRPEHVRAKLQRDAAVLIERALYETGLPAGDYTVDERDKGTLIVLPPDASKSRLTDVLTHRLPLWLRRMAGQNGEQARLRVRIALNCGEASLTKHGRWSGSAIDALTRLIDAAPAGRAPAGVHKALMVLIVSDAWYADAVRPELGDGFADEFTPLTFGSGSRKTRAWLALPGSSRPAAEPPADLRINVLLPAARSGEERAHLAAADKLHDIGKTDRAASVRQLIRQWAAADDPGLQVTAAYALGRRSGEMTSAEAAAQLTELAAQPHSLVAAAVTRACVLAAAGEAADDPRGVWVFRMLESWIGHRDGRIRRTANRALMAMAAGLERADDPRAAAVKLKYGVRAREHGLGDALRPPGGGRADLPERGDQGSMEIGPSAASAQAASDSQDPAPRARAADAVVTDGRTGDPDSPESRHPVGRPGPGAPREGTAPWPGLVWFGELDPRIGRSIAALWRAALVSPQFARPAGRALDLCAHLVEPYPEQREALVRLTARAAAGHELARGTIALRARRWAGRPGFGAPRTGSLVLAVLDPAYAAARVDATGRLDPEFDKASCGCPPSSRHAHHAERHRVRNTTRPPRRNSGRHPTHDHRCH